MKTGGTRPGGSAGWLRAAVSLLVLALAASSQEEPPGPAPQENRARPLVAAVHVEGNVRYSAEQITAAFGQAVGAPLLAENELRRGVEVLFDTFHARAQVELLPPAAGSDQVEILIRVEELPLDPELRITGNLEIADSKVREWAGIGEREELFLYQAPRIRERLLEHYRQEGYYFAEVRVVERPAGVDPETGLAVAPDVIFEIKEGPEVKVRSVELGGNDLLPNSGFLFLSRGLSKLAKVELRGPRFFGLFKKDFVQETLDADIIAMRKVYRDLGYLDAVVELDHLEFSEDREWVTIHISIDEGQPFLVDAIEFETLRRMRDESQPRGYREEPAEPLFSEDELRQNLALKVGDPFQQRLVDDDHRVLRELYGARGHVEHSSLPAWEGFHFLDPELVFDPVAPRVRVVYRLVQGDPISIREILVRGNMHTQDRVIRRQLTVKPGQLADPKQVERSRAKIESTDFFSPDQFRPDIIPPQVRYLDTGDPSQKDLEFAVQEGGVLGFQISGGVSTINGFSGQISLRKGNFDLSNLPSSFGSTFEEVARLEAFHGAGQTLRLVASPGTDLTSYSISFFDPDVFHLHEDYIGLGLDARRTRRRYDTHVEERRDYLVRLQEQLTADSSAFVRYGYGSVDVREVHTGGEPNLSNPLAVPVDLDAQRGKSDLGHLDIGYNFNTVDSRIQPRNGLDVNFQAALYNDLLGSDFDFARAIVNLDFYDEFDEDPDIVSDYVHLGFQLGVAAAYGSTDEVPYTERFFLGGRNLRGFDFRGIGPNENGFPIGGSTSVNATLEYRRPLVKNIQPGSYREIEAIQGGLFIDCGLQDPDEFSLDFGELRASAGFLFGISFPIPLTFSFGFPLREGDGDRKQVFEFEIGF